MRLPPLDGGSRKARIDLMVRRFSTVLPWLLWLVTVAMGASVVVLSLLTPPEAAARMANREWVPSIRDYLFPLESIAFATVGALIVSRRRNIVGWLMCVIGITYLLADVWAQRYLAFSGYIHQLPAADWVAWLNAWVWIPDFGLLFIALPLLFPDGRPPSRRWAMVGWVAVAYIAIITPLAALSPLATTTGSLTGYPLGGGVPAVDFIVPLMQGGGFVPLIVLALAAVASLVARYRKAGPDVRHQIKWIAAAFVLVVLGLPVGLVAPVLPPGLLADTVGNLTQILLVAIPVAMGIAVFKYRLYDIDNVISRTLVYGALAAFITAVYVGIVVGVGALVGSGGQPNLLLSIIATAIVAVAFQPVRERLQRVANRLVYGRRATPYEVLSQFSERVAETYAADEALPRMARVLAEGTGAEHAEVWLRAGSALRPAATWPGANGATPSREPVAITGQLLPTLPAETAVPVRHQGELLGALTVTKRQGESLTPIEQKLLGDLAHQAGLVLKNVGLTAELLARLDDLRASRQRLVAAQDEERRRLERNLHDGAQQNLVALKVKLGLAEMLADKDPERARALLAELKGDTDETLETLRDLARGIYPPLLADKGLAAALAAQARKATLPVIVEADGVGRSSKEIEAAVYFCVLEALQNAQKYAGATEVTVRLQERDGDLIFAVEDNGKGFDPATTPKGSGLQNMADRLDALGGNVAVDSEAGRGTRVTGAVAAEPKAVNA
jgi:signal transduction histidine kinase